LVRMEYASAARQTSGRFLVLRRDKHMALVPQVASRRRCWIRLGPRRRPLPGERHSHFGGKFFSEIGAGGLAFNCHCALAEICTLLDNRIIYVLHWNVKTTLARAGRLLVIIGSVGLSPI